MFLYGLHGHSVCDLCISEGVTPTCLSALESFLVPTLPASVTVRDPALQVIALLRVLHALDRYWFCLYEVSVPRAFSNSGNIARQHSIGGFDEQQNNKSWGSG